MPVVFANQGHNPLDHLRSIITVVRMFVSTPEDRINDKSVPCHLNGLKSLLLFICRFDPMTLLCFIIVHDHGVQTNNNHQRLHDLQAPQKQLPQNLPKHKSPRQQHSSEEPFHRMRGQHTLSLCLNTAGISLIFLKFIKVGQMSTCAVHEKAEKLLKNLGNALPLIALSYSTKNLLQIGKQGYTSQISNKQTQSSPAGKIISSDFDIINNCAGIIICATIFHCELPPIGFYLWLIILLPFLYLYHKLTHLGGLFFRQKSIILGIDFMDSLC